MAFAIENIFDTIIIDTAGRLHVDEVMMDEIAEIKRITNPSEILFVVDSMTGQDAVNTAKVFNEQLNFDGVVLTKLDGDARGGAALSIKTVVKNQLNLLVSEKKLMRSNNFIPKEWLREFSEWEMLFRLSKKRRKVLIKTKRRS